MMVEMRGITVSFIGGKTIRFNKEGTVAAEKLNSNTLEDLLQKFNKIEFMEMETEECTALSLEFGNNRECYFGYFEADDTIYYCWSYKDKDAVKIVRHFGETGKRDISYNWIRNNN